MTANNLKEKKMKSQDSNSMISSQYGNKSIEKITSAQMQTSQLKQLFEDELKDIYRAEKALANAIPMMIKNTSSPELIDELTNHLTETEFHITRLEVFESIERKATPKKSQTMEGLIKVVDEIMEFCEAGAMRDAGIISAMQKIKHYEIETYRTLWQLAETLDLADAVALLGDTLDEEKATEEKLTKIAKSINVKAVAEASDTMFSTKNSVN